MLCGLQSQIKLQNIGRCWNNKSIGNPRLSQKKVKHTWFFFQHENM